MAESLKDTSERPLRLLITSYNSNSVFRFLVEKEKLVAGDTVQPQQMSDAVQTQQTSDVTYDREDDMVVRLSWDWEVPFSVSEISTASETSAEDSSASSAMAIDDGDGEEHRAHGAPCMHSLDDEAKNGLKKASHWSADKHRFERFVLLCLLQRLCPDSVLNIFCFLNRSWFPPPSPHPAFFL